MAEPLLGTAIVATPLEKAANELNDVYQDYRSLYIAVLPAVVAI